MSVSPPATLIFCLFLFYHCPRQFHNSKTMQVLPIHQQQQFTLPDGQAVPAKHVPSAGTWWSRMSLRLLSIIFSIAIIGVSAFYYAHWTLGALIMMGPPVRQLGRVLACPLLNIFRHSWPSFGTAWTLFAFAFVVAPARTPERVSSSIYCYSSASGLRQV